MNGGQRREVVSGVDGDASGSFLLREVWGIAKPPAIPGECFLHTKALAIYHYTALLVSVEEYMARRPAVIPFNLQLTCPHEFEREADHSKLVSVEPFEDGLYSTRFGGDE